MERLPVPAIDVGGTPGAGKYLDSDGNWSKPSIDDPGDQFTPGDAAQVLTSIPGEVVWFGNVTVLIEEGGTVPPGTPIGAIIIQKGSAP